MLLKGRKNVFVAINSVGLYELLLMFLSAEVSDDPLLSRSSTAEVSEDSPLSRTSVAEGSDACLLPRSSAAGRAESLLLPPSTTATGGGRESFWLDLIHIRCAGYGLTSPVQ